MKIFTTQLNISGSTHISGSGTQIRGKTDSTEFRWNDTHTEIQAQMNHSASYYGAMMISPINTNPFIVGGKGFHLFGAGDAENLQLFAEYGFYGEIKNASGYVEMTASRGGATGFSLPMSGSALVEIAIIGIESGSMSADGATRPEMYHAVQMNIVSRWAVAYETAKLSPSTVIFRDRDDAFWDSDIAVDNTLHTFRVYAIDNGEDSVWCGTVRVWKLNESIYGGQLGT